MDDLIKRFVELHDQTRALIASEQISDAKKKYLDVLSAYQSIEHSNLDPLHKQIAHDHVTSLFKDLNSAKERLNVPYNLIAAAVLIIAFSILVVFNPSIVGLASLENTLVLPINQTFTESSLRTFTLADRPLSLAASGTYEGRAKIFLKQGNQLRLIMSSDNATGGTFTDFCQETCSIIAESNSIELFIDIAPNSSLTLDALTYKTERKPNTAPAWKGSSRTFKAPLGKPLTIDLSDYFTDAENDALTFASSAAEGLDVDVRNSIVTLTGKTAGTKNIVFVASDLKDVTRVSVSIDVA